MRLALLAAGLLFAGWLAQGLVPGRDEGGPLALAPLAGRGVLLPVLGGYRALAADVLWLRAYGAWRERDAGATEAWLRAAVAADGRSRHYRINGARMLAYDFPAWTDGPDVPQAVRDQARRRHAERAMALLEEGLTGVGAEADYLVELARIAHQQLGDLDRAAEYYRRAAVSPGAPYFAGRLHAELLVRAGRVREARDWLRAWEPTLPAEEPSAARAVVAARLAELERMLAAP